MKTYFRILHYIRPYRELVVLTMLVSIVFVLMNSLSVWIVGSLINTIISPESRGFIENPVSINEHLKVWTQNLIGHGSKVEQLKSLCILLLGIFAVKNISFYVSRVSLSFVQNKMINDIRNKLFTHIQNLPMSYFDKNKTGEMISILVHDVSSMRVAFTQSLQNLVIEPFNILVFMSLLFIISPKMTLISFVSLPISAFVILKIGQSIRRKAKRSSQQIAGLMNILQETVSGIRIVKTFSMEKLEVKRFLKENYKFFKLVYRQSKLSLLISPINDMIGVSTGVLLLWFGGVEVLQGRGLQSEDFMRFILLLFAIMQPAKKLGNVNAQIQAGLASADRVFGILDIPNKIQDPEHSKPYNQFSDNIQFKKVQFQYESNDIPALFDINIEIKKGEVIALVGSSGAGKTTFVDLVPRFYDVSNGSISIDGIDIRDLKIDDLRSKMGIVSQDTILFNDTIANNIAYGSPTSNQDDIVDAAKIANAFEFISNLPNQFDTIIGERGTRLSGGQRQRITVARAILKNPDILILDEATSALDSESEKKVQLAIDNLVKDRTVIVIAHRLSTIKNADRIVVLDNGKIVEIGNHEELLFKNGYYKKLYEIQYSRTVSN